MNFAALPPEINSGRMYTGPGSAPMLAAASAWQRLGAELNVAAITFNSQIVALTDGPWTGPAAAAMASVAGAQIQWLSVTSALALDSAARAESAASAFETAFAMTVPPELVAANRVLLTSLIATNALGQNAGAIAATEGHYAQMWSDDVAAMTAYAQASVSATRLTPFEDPGGRPAAATQGVSTSSVVPTLTRLTASIPVALQSLSVPTAATSTSGIATLLADLGFTSPISFLTPINTGLTATSLSGGYSAWGSASHADGAIVATQQQIDTTEGRILQRLDRLQSASVTGASQPVGALAQSGQAAVIGKLSVPQAWTGAVPVARHALLASYVADAPISAAEPAVGADGLPNVVGPVSPAVSGQAAVTTASLRRWERRLAAETSAGYPPRAAADSSLIGIADELRNLAALCDAHVLTEDEFLRQKRRLLGE